jgi:ADP-ribosylglycohydrolase
MLLEIAVGDAYGVKFENLHDADLIRRNNNLSYKWKYQEDFQPSIIPPGYYTDDTQMSLAIAEAMLDDDESWSKESMAEWFIEVFHRNQRRGYTTFFLNALLNSESGRELLSRIGGRSTKSGAAMRSAPLGMHKRMGEAVAKARAHAMVTHDSWEGRESAIAVAMSSWYFYHNQGPREGLVEWLNETRYSGNIHAKDAFYVEGVSDDKDDRVLPWFPDLERSVRIDAWECLECALYAIESADNLGDILKYAVSFGGDTDTVAAIAMGIASASDDIEKNLPEELIAELENRQFGHDYLLFVDKKLSEKFPKSADEPEEIPEVALDIETVVIEAKEPLEGPQYTLEIEEPAETVVNIPDAEMLASLEESPDPVEVMSLSEELDTETKEE